MKQIVINHRNSFCYKLLVVIMFEWPVYSMVTWLEDAVVVLAEKNTTFTFFR
jgi:hypothetical protein